MGRRFAFHRVVGGEDDFFDTAVLRPFQQTVEMDFLVADTVQRGKAPHQHEVQPVVGSHEEGGRRAFGHEGLA